jgi:hypothetical protein
VVVSGQAAVWSTKGLRQWSMASTFWAMVVPSATWWAWHRRQRAQEVSAGGVDGWGQFTECTNAALVGGCAGSMECVTKQLEMLQFQCWTLSKHTLTDDGMYIQSVHGCTVDCRRTWVEGKA